MDNQQQDNINNLKIKRFPTNLMAGMFGYSQRDYFEASEQSKEVPNVNFD